MLQPFALLFAGMLATQAPVDAGVAAFGDACLSTVPATRESLSRLARAKGWRAIRRSTPEGLDWRDDYRAGETFIHLDQHRVSDLNPGERICVVLVGQAPAGWREQVSALTVDGSMVGAPDTYDHNRYQIPPELELTVWDLPDGSRIHALRTAGNLLELSVNYPTGR